MKTRVFLADDHAVLRAGLRMLIDAQPDMEVVGEAADGDEAIEKVKEVRPDIVLLDLAMPHHGLPAIGPIRQVLPETRVLVLTMHDDPAYLKPVMEAGGSGFIVKTAADSELLTAIRVVAEGRIFINLSVHARVRQVPKPGGEDSV
jgi:two-component system response regulator NreC